jgi:hypothetical protein
MKINNPVIDQAYTLTFTIHVVLKNGITSYGYMPMVGVNAGTTVDNGMTTGSTLSKDIADLGNWSWSATGSYVWNWNTSLNRGINMQRYNSFSNANNVQVNFSEGYNYNINGDSFTNGTVTGSKNWSTNLYNQQDSTSQQVTAANATLTSSLTFDGMSPTPSNSTSPYLTCGTSVTSLTITEPMSASTPARPRLISSPVSILPARLPRQH